VVVTVASAAIVLQDGSGGLSVDAGPATTWLSAEAEGRIALAAVGATGASATVSISDTSSAFDVVDLGAEVLVHDRREGSLVRVDGRDGSKGEESPAPVLADGDPAVVVGAGTVAFLLDPAAGTVTRLDGTNEPLEVGAFTDWAPDRSGRVWLVDSARGAVASVSLAASSWSRVAEPGSDLAVTVVGTDPVVLDRTTGRLRWPERSTTLDLELSAGEAAGALLQEPSAEDGCVGLVVGRTARCVGPEGDVGRIELTDDVSPVAQLFATPAALVVATADDRDVVVGTWSEGGSATVAERNAPSPRALSSWTTTGQLLVDDPGSRYAFTTDGRTLTMLDKLSSRAVAIDGAEDDDVTPPDAPSQPLFGEGSEELVDQSSGNEAPVANPDTLVTRAGRDTVANVLANDGDPDGDLLAVLSAGPTTGLDVVVADAASVVIGLPPDAAGPYTVPYTIVDPSSLRASSTVTVEVAGDDENTDPDAVDDEATTSEGRAVSIPVLANDTDPESDPLVLVDVSAAGSGTVAIDTGGRVRYEPAPGFSGVDELEYTVGDGFGGEATARVTVDVAPATAPNRPPVAVDDRASTVAGVAARVPVLTNDFDPDAEELRIVSVQSVGGAPATIVAGRALNIVPEPSVAGPLLFGYTVEDSRGARASASLLLVVSPPVENRPPQAVDDVFTIGAGAADFDLLANDTDPDNDLLTLVDVSRPGSGATVVRISPTQVRVQPDGGFAGTVEFSYEVSDPAGGRDRADVRVEVVPAPKNSGPIARNDTAEIMAGQTARIRPLDNDTHPEGLAFGLDGPPTARGGIVTVDGDEVTFEPISEQGGTYVLAYTIRDTEGLTSSAEIVVTVRPRPVSNDPPIAQDDRAYGGFRETVSINVLDNDFDTDGNPIRLVSVGRPSPGGSTDQAGDLVRFTPPALDAGGLFSFTYTIEDSRGATATGRVLVEVGPRPLVPPIANDDLLVVTLGTTSTFDPRVNDVDPDDPGATLRLEIIGAYGPITASLGGGGIRVTGTSVGTGTVVYRVTDADNVPAVANVTVNVEPPPNKPPVARDDTATTEYEAAVAIPVTSNDTDPDGGTIRVLSVTAATGGTVTINTAGDKVTFTPATGFTGTTTFTYTLVDPGGLTAAATVTVTVAPCSAVLPVVVGDTASTAASTAVTIPVLANDTTPTGTLTVTQPAAGTGTVTIVDAAKGEVRYTPPAATTLVATFTYTLTNKCGNKATATVTVTVNRAPVAVADNVTIPRDTEINIAVLANDTDADGDKLDVISVAGATGGIPSLKANNTVTFTPTPGFVGTAGFTYTIRDAGMATATGIVTITVTQPNRNPVANPDAAITTAGVAVPIPVLANDTDPDGDPLAVTGVSAVAPGAAGTATFTPTSVTFTPAAGFTGIATFTYTVSDGRGGTATGSVSVTVNPPPNQSPTANPDGGASTGGPVTVDVTANDTDPDGDPLTVTAVTVTIGTGIATFGGTTVTYTPATPAVAETATITYTISDGRGGTSSSTLTIVVTP
jgi:carbon monoxide dehydrogenase subunit G